MSTPYLFQSQLPNSLGQLLLEDVPDRGRDLYKGHHPCLTSPENVSINTE